MSGTLPNLTDNIAMGVFDVFQIPIRPWSAIAAELALFGPVALACRWLVLTDEGEVALAGTTPPAADASFVLPLGGRLRPGAYTVAAAVLVNGNAVDLAITRIPYAVD
jgi:hypothetical protein